MATSTRSARIGIHPLTPDSWDDLVSLVAPDRPTPRDGPDAARGGGRGGQGPGAPAIDARPIEATGPRSRSSLYRGPLPLCLGAGFTKAAQVPVPPVTTRVIVGRELG